MRENKGETFEEWYSIFTDEINKREYKGVIEKSTFRIDYDCARCPIASANIFVDDVEEFYS